jgi:hypothetical protein
MREWRRDAGAAQTEYPPAERPSAR